MTLEEIAALAGVSRSTVSRVLNEQPNVNDDTRQRVMRVVQERGFHPNRAARALASKRSQIIGLVIPQALSSVFSEPYFATLIKGIAAACDVHGYYLMLSIMTSTTPEAYGRIIGGGHLDGVVVASALTDDPLISRLQTQQFPFVLIGRNPGHSGITTVDVDNVQGAAAAARHLVRLGYSRVATITGPLNMIAAVDRKNGFLNAVRAAGLACPDHWLVEGDWSEGGGFRGMQRLLQDHVRPQAVFVASDVMAAGALRAVRSAGLRVPEDMALIGFDDLPLALALDPPLTTMRQPIEQLGFTAASVLINTLLSSFPPAPDADGHEASTFGDRIILPTELVIRESCGQMARYAPQ